MGLDLESLKEQVSSMRNSVKQTKNHLINKLTREAKKLREKKGTDEQKKKNAKKADRFIEEVMLMKKLHPDQVSKFVLKTENCEKLLSKPDIPVETKVLARFGAHKVLSPIISKFHADHLTWKEDIEDLIEKVVIEPKQTVPAPKLQLNSSIVRTAGNNVFSVTPVKQSLNPVSRNSLSSNSKLDKINGAKRRSQMEEARMKKENRNSVSVANKTPVKPIERKVELSPKKRNSFVDSSSSSDEESEESEESEDSCEETFSKAFKRQKPDESDSEEDENEDEESSVGSSEISDVAETLNLKQANVSGKTAKKQKIESKISDLNGKPAEKTHLTENISFKSKVKKQSKLNEELDEIEERLNRKKGPKQVAEVEETPEESIDPFFVTPEGEEYISSAPIVKNEDKPSFSSVESTSTPREFYRKGKKITPSVHGQRNSFHNQNGKSSFNRNDNRNSFNRNDNRNSFNRYDNRNSFNRNDNRNSFNRNDSRNSFNRNDSRNSFNRNDSRNSFNRNDSRNSFNRNDNRNSFHRNDNRNSFHRNDNRNGNSSSFGDRRNSYDNNEKKSSFGSNFNAKNRFGNNKNDSKFNSRKQDAGNNEHLHPSWEAKKKMSALAPFQGIKTVFNE